MAQSKQYNVKMQWGVQTSAYGTAATPGTAVDIPKSFTPSMANNVIYDRGLGDGRNVSRSLYGNFDAGGSLSTELIDFEMLKLWIGPLSGAGTSGDPYVLTEDAVVGLTSGDIQVFTLEVNHQEGSTDEEDSYVGCVGNSFTLAGSVGEPLTFDGEFVARNVVSSTSGTSYTAKTGTPWMMNQATVKWGSTPSTVAGVLSFSITMNNNLIVTRDIGSRFIQIPDAGLRDYTFNMVVKMTSTVATTLRDDFYGQADQPVDGVATATLLADREFKIELTEGTASSQRQATIWLDQASIDSIGKSVAVGDELVVVEISGTGQSARSNTLLRWWTN